MRTPGNQQDISEVIFLHHLRSKTISAWLWPPFSVSQRNFQGSWKASVSHRVWSREPSPGQWEWSSRDVSLQTPCGNKTINAETPQLREGQTEPCCMQKQLIYLDKSSVIWITAARGQDLSESSMRNESCDTVNHISIQWRTTESAPVSELFSDITRQNCKQTSSFGRLDILIPQICST